MSGELRGMGVPVGPSLPVHRSGNVALRKARRLSPKSTDTLVCSIMVEMQYRLLKFCEKDGHSMNVFVFVLL